jgi:hypothetical protein
MHPRPRLGLGFLDLVAVVAMVGVLAALLVPQVRERQAAGRDARRVQDLEQIRWAIERFREQRGRWPEPQPSAAHGGWDVSGDGAFLPELVAAGFLPAEVHDPLDDEAHHYRYNVYAPGEFRCGGGEPYYVLGLRAFETDGFAARSGPGFACEERDWGAELAWVCGGGVAQP